ncbi:MAG TPA: hypothetical protein VER32_07585 [Pyrinomonadaceae bacterium]|nr:hypothetical protein [Pyrinomonadaceae bacterium]
MKIRLSLVLAVALLFAAAWGAALYFEINHHAASPAQRSESR